MECRTYGRKIAGSNLGQSVLSLPSLRSRLLHSSLCKWVTEVTARQQHGRMRTNEMKTRTGQSATACDTVHWRIQNFNVGATWRPRSPLDPPLTRSRAGWKTLPFSLRQYNPREVHLFTVPVTSTIWTQLHGTCLEITTPRNFADSILFDSLFRKTCIFTYRETDIRCLKYRYIFAPLHGRALFIRTSHIRDGIAAA